MKRLVLTILATAPLFGVLAVVPTVEFSNGFVLDTRPSPEIAYAVIDNFSTFPVGCVIVIR